MAISHRRTNTIEMLNIGKVANSEALVIRDHFVDFLENLLTEQERWRLKLDGLIFDSIKPQKIYWLERPFEELEVYGVMRMMVKDKTLGHDGFFMGFFQVCWQ